MEPVTTGSAVDFTWLFLKMIGALGVVSVLAIVILKYVVPRLGFTKRFHQGKVFRVLNRFQLEPRKTLYLVNIGKRYLVLGVADSGIQVVTEVTKEEAEGNT